MSKSILITGGKGLVGSKFTQLFENTYQFEPLDVSDAINPVDITNKNAVIDMFSRSPATFVVHLAAFTDVTAAWSQKGDMDGSAYKVNVVGTENVVAAAEQTGKHIIHISTAYVFDGLKSSLYHEDDPVNPIEWYGFTKAKAEEVVLAAKCPATILRIDQPFRSDTFSKDDLVRKIIKNITSSSPYPLFTNHYLGPTFIDDFAKVIDWVIRTSTTGLFHASSGEKISDFELATLINETHNLRGTVLRGDLNEYLKRLDRPYQVNTAMDITKLTSQLDFKLLSLAEAIKKIII